MLLPRYTKVVGLFAFLIGVVPCILLSVWFLFQLHSTSIAGAQYGLDWRVRNATTDIKSILSEASIEIENLAKQKAMNIAPLDILYSSDAYDKLQSFQQKFPLFDALVLYDTERLVVEATPIKAVNVYSAQLEQEIGKVIDQFEIAASGLARFVILQDPMLRSQIEFLSSDKKRIQGDHLVLVLVPLTIAQDSLLHPLKNTGVLLGIIRLESIVDLIKQQYVFKQEQTLFSIMQSKKSLYSELPSSEVLRHVEGSERYLVHQENIAFDFFKPDGDKTQLDLAVFENKAFHLRSLNQTFLAIMLVLALFLVVLVLVIRRLVRQLSLPLEFISATTKAFLRGEYFPVKNHMHYAEFYSLVDLLNQMAQRINVQMDELRAESERAEQAAQAKSDFLANMSHEIRTPMNAILGLSELMQKTPLNSTQQHYLSNINQSSQTLLGIINDVLDYSKIEAGKLALESIPFNVSEMACNLHNIFMFQAEQKKIEFLVELDDALPEQLQGDPLRVKQVLINLVNNALKFTAQGDVKLVVKLLSQQQGEYRVLFQVIDSGIGISDEHLQNLFIPFNQADSSTTRQYGGTGLGLTICKRLVDMMQGQIRVQSVLGQGSCFEFELSLLQAEQLDVQQEIAEGHAEQLLLKASPKRILLVEDNYINQLVIGEMLKPFPFEIEIAADGEVACEKVQQSAFDLVLMDIQMPKMDGYTATQHIREQLNLLQLPIIALTANVMEGDRHKSLQVGMNDFIAKPVNTQTLYEVLARYLIH